MRFAVHSDVGRVRSGNEDNYAVINLQEQWPGHVFAVADGMGGYEAGELASALAVMHFVDYVRQALPGLQTAAAGEQAEALGDGQAQALAGGGVEVLEQIVAAAVRAANEAIAREAQAHNASGMGTTLTAALVTDSLLVWAHVGDSRAYLIRGNTIDQLTEDHSLVGEMVKSGSLTEAEAMQHPQRNILTSALGPGSLNRLDTGSLLCCPGDMLLLCTDGLTNLVSAAELCAEAQLARSSAAAFEALPARLVELANQRGGPDNITVVAVELP